MQAYKVIVRVCAFARAVPCLRQNVLVKCHHALLVHLDYALQTELHVILVLNLATSGTIQVSAAPMPLPCE